jgi:hypothetical protein
MGNDPETASLPIPVFHAVPEPSFSAAIIISTFGITNVFILTGARVYQVMAQSRAFLNVEV